MTRSTKRNMKRGVTRNMTRAMKRSMTRNMTRGMKKVAAVAVLILASVTSAGGRDLKTVLGLRNFLWINTEVCSAGQPTTEHLRQLKEQGVKAVLNLRRPSEYNEGAESAAVRKMGMKYFNIPVDSANMKDAYVEGFLRIVSEPAYRPIFVHCASANRVGAFWMIKRVVMDGWPVERAEREAHRIGLRSPTLVGFARDYIHRHEEKQKQEAQKK